MLVGDLAREDELRPEPPLHLCQRPRRGEPRWRPQDLERDVLAELTIERLVDDTHAAAAKQLQHVVSRTEVLSYA